MEIFHTRIEADGKIQLPPQILKHLDFEVGKDVELEVEKKSLRVSLGVTEQRRQAQEFVKRKLGKTHSAVDEFIEERRQEALND